MISVTIGGVDKTNVIEDITTIDTINSQVDTADFSILKAPGDSYIPALNAEVIVTRGSFRVFGGVITSIKDELVGANSIRYNITSNDFTFQLNRLLAVERYEGQTINYIINDLITKYAPDFTVTNVAADIVVNSIAFNRITLSECFRKLADLVNYTWYVDYYKDIHFVASNAEPAPFDVTDGNYIRESLSIERNITQLRNRVTVIGGEVPVPTRTVKYAGNGSTASFSTQYKFASLPTVTVGGVPKTVGVDFKDDDLSFECMWDFNQEYIRFTAGNIPADPGTGTNIDIIGEPLLPLLVSIPDSASILTFGEFEFSIADKNITSEDQAIDRALAELKAYASSVSEGQFDTYQPGLRSGQVIRVTDALRGLDEDFVIQKVTYKYLSPDDTYDGVWSVSLATLKTVGIVSVLQKLLLKEDLTVDEQQRLLAYRSASDRLRFKDNTLGDSQCDYRVKITVDKTNVPSNQTGFPVYVDLSHLPASFFAHVEADGRDIRVFASDGLTELPYELVSIDTVLKTGELFFKGDLSSTVNTDFYIYYGNPALAAYARTDTYGSNNVWTGAHGIYHATVNANDSSANNLPGTLFEVTQENGYWDFKGHAKIAESASTLTGTTALPFGKVTTYQRVAQSFTLESTTSQRLDLMVQKLANVGAPTAAATIAIHADSAGVPNATAINSTTIQWNGTGSLSTGVDFIVATLQSGMAGLTLGTTYWVVLTYSTASDTHYPNVAYDPSGTYGVLKYYNGTSWVTLSGSLRFRLFKSGYVDRGGSTPNMSTQNMQVTVRLKKTDTTYESIADNGAQSTSHLEINRTAANTLAWRPNSTSGSAQQNIASGVNTGDGTWRNYCWRLNATNQTLFVNGANVGTASANVLATNQLLRYFGQVQNRLNSVYGQALKGQLKFLRIRPAQTDDFNLTESRNLDAPATFYTVGGEEDLSDTIVQVTTTSAPYFVGTTAVMGFSTIG